mgnify:CR=1 FL=1
MSKNINVIKVMANNNLVIDSKPKMINPMQPIEQERMYSITITAGMYMPLPILTYPIAQTFNSPKTS